MFDQGTGPANNVLDSVHRRFVDETYGVNGLFFESILRTQDQLATLRIANNPEQLFAKSRILREGLSDFLESVVKLTHIYAGRLIAIIVANSQMCKGEDPAQWIRHWLEDHLRNYLRQELNLEKLADVAWQRRIANKATAGESKEHSVPNRKHKCSRVESWLRRVADNDRHPDLWKDQPDWLAPIWCEEESTIKLILKKIGTNPARLTQEQTARLIRSKEHGFAARLEYVLGVEEDEARINFAQRPEVTMQKEGPRHSTKQQERIHNSPQKPLMLKYRSGLKRAILGALTKNPSATDADVCRSLDADGAEDLPHGWRSRKEDRSFFAAYASPRTKRKIEIAISKIRRDLRDRGLLR